MLNLQVRQEAEAGRQAIQKVINEMFNPNCKRTDTQKANELRKTVGREMAGEVKVLKKGSGTLASTRKG